MDVCPDHGKMMELLGRIEQRLEDGQRTMIELKEICACNSGAVKEVKGIVTNGLKSDVERIKQTMQILEDFDWFRKGIQKMRDRLFWNALKGVCLVVIFMVLFHLTDAATISIVKGLVK